MKKNPRKIKIDYDKCYYRRHRVPCKYSEKQITWQWWLEFFSRKWCLIWTLIMYTDLPWTVPIYAYSVGVIITSTFFYSQKNPSFNYKFLITLCLSERKMSHGYPDRKLGVENILTIANGMYIDLETEENVVCSENTNNKIIILSIEYSVIENKRWCWALSWAPDMETIRRNYKNNFRKESILFTN